MSKFRDPQMTVDAMRQGNLLRQIETVTTDVERLKRNVVTPVVVSEGGFITSVEAGLGMTGGGSSGVVTLNVGAGPGLEVLADTVGLLTPGSLSVATANDPNGNHVHEIISSANPGQTESLLQTTAAGLLTLYQLGVTNRLFVPDGSQAAPGLTWGNDTNSGIWRFGEDVLALATGGVTRQVWQANGRIAINTGADAAQAQLEVRDASAGQALRVSRSSSLYSDLIVTSGGSLHVDAVGNIELDPAGGQVNPGSNLGANLGQPDVKWLSAYIAEANVEVVAIREKVTSAHGRFVIASGGTILMADLGSGASKMSVKHNDIEADDVIYLEKPGQIEYIRIDGMDILTVSEGTPGRFLVSGDQTAFFSIDDLLHVSNSSLNDGAYTITAVSYNGALDFTEIIVAEQVDGDTTGVIDWTGPAAGPYGYFGLARNRDLSGANDWTSGDGVVNTGQAEDGLLDLFAINGVFESGATAGPAIAGQIRNSSTWDDTSRVFQLGHLQGVYGQTAGTMGVGLGRRELGYNHLLVLDSGIFMMADENEQVASWVGTTIKLGDVDGYHTEFTPTSFKVKNNTAVLTEVSGGNVTVGQVAPNVANTLITSSQIKMRINTSDKIIVDTNFVAIGTTTALNSRLRVKHDNVGLGSVTSEAIYALNEKLAASTADHSGVRGEMIYNSNSGNLVSATGVQALSVILSGGTATLAYGVKSEVSVQSDSTITEARAVSALVSSLHSGTTLSTAYGVHAAYIWNGAITTAYGVKADITKSSTGTATTVAGLSTSIGKTSGAMTNVYGVHAVISNSGGGNMTNVYGVHAVISNSGGGNMTNVYGVEVSIDIDVGTTTEAAYIHLAGQTSAGTISNLYGLLMEDFSGTNRWGVYTKGDLQSFFGGGIVMANRTGHPSNPTADTQVKFYMAGNKLVVFYRDGTTNKYRYLDLESTNATWVYSTTAP